MDQCQPPREAELTAQGQQALAHGLAALWSRFLHRLDGDAAPDHATFAGATFAEQEPDLLKERGIGRPVGHRDLAA